MANNRGTLEGDIQEIEFVREFNKNKKSAKYDVFTKGLPLCLDNVYMVRVTTNQFSKLSNKITKTRSDCYAVYSVDDNINSVLVDNDFYLSESLLEGIDHIKIDKTGVSVKIADSNNFQILKMRPKSFFELFGNYELGAGSSLFCLRENELIKNRQLLEGWCTTADRMTEYFDFVEHPDDLFCNKNVCENIKNFCNNKISQLINDSRELKEKIFNGYPIYEEPYSAWYLFSHGALQKLNYIPFVVTTGSGRTHGDYTLVLKPKKEG